MSVLDRCIINSHPVFGPSINVITAITNAPLAAVTTNTDHGYVDGNIVRLDIAEGCGMEQMDGMTSPILVTGATTFTTQINSVFFDTFSIPASPNPQVNICSLVVPFAEINSSLESAVVNIL